MADLVREWTQWTHEKGGKLDKPDGAFIAFCKQKMASRPGRMMSEALGDANQLGLALNEVMRGGSRRGP